MQTIDFPPTPRQTAVFLNGERRHPLDWQYTAYRSLLIADGAWNYLHNADILQTASRVRVIGDGDSIAHAPDCFERISGQDNTDFAKIVRLLIAEKVTQADVFWGSGGEMDHFLGNLSVAAKYGQYIDLRFYDDKQCYFYSAEDCLISAAQGQGISLYPFSEALVSSRGLRYEMHSFFMRQDDKQSLRNTIVKQELQLTLHGNMFIFITLQNPRLNKV